VLLVVSPSRGYGASGNAPGVDSDDTVVFVAALAAA
jgi:hypothetical protein